MLQRKTITNCSGNNEETRLGKECEPAASSGSEIYCWAWQREVHDLILFFKKKCCTLDSILRLDSKYQHLTKKNETRSNEDRNSGYGEK